MSTLPRKLARLRSPRAVAEAVRRRLAGPTPGQLITELYGFEDVWPSIQVFPEPYVYDPEGVDREIADLEPRSVGRPLVLPPVFVNDVPGAAIRASGLIQVADGRILLDSIKRPSQLLRSQEPVRRPERIIDRTGIGSTIVLAGRLPNYFHWVVDMLPRLYALEKVGGSVELVLPPDIPRFAEDLIDGLVGDRFPIFRCPPGCAVRYDAVRLSPFTTIGAHGLLRPEIVQWMRDRLVPDAPAPEDRRRLLLRRAGANMRDIGNEPALLAALEPFGVEPVRQEELSVREQVSLLASAELLIGPCGAGFTNMLWARDAAVVDMNPGGREGYWYHPAFWSLAKSSGHRYLLVPHAEDLHVPRFDVDVARVRRAVERAIVMLDEAPASAIVT